MKQFVLTPAMGKRLIGKAMVEHPAIRQVLKTGTLVIIAGTTNGYVAEEILRATGQAEGFSRVGFRRGTVTPPDFDPASGEQGKLEGDVVLVKGAWEKGKTIFDVADRLRRGDVILKGANAVNLTARQAAALIGHPQAGTAGPAVAAAVGRKVRLMVPVGLEKRVGEPIPELAAVTNDPAAEGPGMLPLPGEVFTELEAIALLTGARAGLLAGGGIYGAEGSVWIGVAGEAKQVEAAEKLIRSLADEPPCRV
jgi:hypothetical protein